ncbi:TPA: hypothetical protein MD261_002893 [Klebsiella aerogenes]|nr:hypothetical protein [Klebsiella aerogenes]
MRFFRFSFATVFCIIDFIHFCNQDNAMSDLNARLLAQRIDTVLDILVAGEYHSAIHNLEILKAELQALSHDEPEKDSGQSKAPWEI